MILFCLDNFNENPFLEEVGFDFFLFFAINSNCSLGQKYKFTFEAVRTLHLKNFGKVYYKSYYGCSKGHKQHGPG